jgi:hypothetical protein
LAPPQVVAENCPLSAQYKEKRFKTSRRGKNFYDESLAVPIRPNRGGRIQPCSRKSCSSALLERVETYLQAEVKKGNDEVFAAYDADKAYREAMPPLSGYENIRDFIVCTAHGMLIGAILDKQGAKLLYAAQVALCMARSESAPPKITACPSPHF